MRPLEELTREKASTVYLSPQPDNEKDLSPRRLQERRLPGKDWDVIVEHHAIPKRLCLGTVLPCWHADDQRGNSGQEKSADQSS